MRTHWIKVGLAVAVTAALPVWLVSPNVAVGLSLASATLATFLLVSVASEPRAAGREADDAAAGWHAFLREIDRSRRHERPLTLAALPVRSGLAPLEARSMLRAAARSIDVVWVDNRVLYLAMPETGRAAALAVVARLRREHEGVLGRGDWRVVVYPDDALTADALVARLAADNADGLEPSRVRSSSL